MKVEGTQDDSLRSKIWRMAWQRHGIQRGVCNWSRGFGVDCLDFRLRGFGLEALSGRTQEPA